MKKLTTFIFLILYGSLGVAESFPPPPKENPCHPYFGCDGVPIDDYISLMFIVALFLGAWIVQQRNNRVKTDI